MRTRVLSSILVLTLVLCFSACEKDPPASLYNPDAASAPAPTVSKIDPPNALAGVTVLTITGANFNPDPIKNMVFFDKTNVPVTAATATQLTVKAPNLPKDTIAVKVATVGSDHYSTAYLYRLVAAQLDFGTLKSGEGLAGVECDKDGNVYYSSVLTDTAGAGVRRVSTTGVQTRYSPAFSPTVAAWKNMRFGPGGALFCVTARQIIFRIPPGGGAAAVWQSSGLTPLNDLDFDQQGNIWTGGTGNKFYRVRSTDKNVLSFPFTGTIRAVRVYNGYLYLGGKRDTLEKIWRYQITSADAVGPEEEVFDLSSVYGANSYGCQGLTISNDGDLYVATDAAEGIRIVHPATKTSEPMYSGVVTGPSVAITWGAATDLYQARMGTTPSLVKLQELKTGAPYYGRTLP